MDSNEQSIEPNSADKSLKTYVTIVYACLLAGWLLGGMTAIVGVILNYATKEKVIGTIYESHYKYQVRTFWFGLLWMIVGVISSFILIGYFVLFANSIWISYRAIKGFMKLQDGEEI